MVAVHAKICAFVILKLTTKIMRNLEVFIIRLHCKYNMYPSHPAKRCISYALTTLFYIYLV